MWLDIADCAVTLVKYAYLPLTSYTFDLLHHETQVLWVVGECWDVCVSGSYTSPDVSLLKWGLLSWIRLEKVMVPYIPAINCGQLSHFYLTVAVTRHDDLSC